MERVRVARPDSGRPRTRPDHLGGDKAYSSRRNRRHIKHTIPEPKKQRANRQHRGSRGGQPTGFDTTIYKRRNEVVRTINALKNSRAVATRHDKRAYIFHGTVTVASYSALAPVPIEVKEPAPVTRKSRAPDRPLRVRSQPSRRGLRR